MRLVAQFPAGKTPVQTEAVDDLFFQISSAFGEVSLGVQDERQTIFDLDMRIGALLDCVSQVLFQRIPLHLQFVSARVDGGTDIRVRFLSHIIAHGLDTIRHCFDGFLDLPLNGIFFRRVLHLIENFEAEFNDLAWNTDIVDLLQDLFFKLCFR